MGKKSLTLRIKVRISKLLWKYYRPFFIDYYFVSFPKSGRTWINLILSKYFFDLYNVPLKLDFHKLHRYNKNIPFIHFTHLCHRADKEERIKAIKKLRGKKIIFMVRDPKDVIVSYYFQRKNRIKKYDKTINEFIYDKEFGINQIINYLNDFINNMGVFDQFYLIKYEDFKKDTFSEVVKLFKFIKLANIDSELLRKAVEYTSFENMKKLEENNCLDDYRLRPINKKDPYSYKVRSGQTGSYKNYLNSEEINYLEKNIRLLNNKIGYSRPYKNI